MIDVVRTFQEGGWTMFPLLACVLVTHPLAIGAAIAAFVSKRRGMVIGLGATALLLSLGAVAIGVGGYLIGMRQVDLAIAGAGLPPEQSAAILAQGRAEASVNWMCGLAGAALPVLVSLIAIARGVAMREPAGPPARG